jgi:ubiquitin C-terminal hydrolase
MTHFGIRRHKTRHRTDIHVFVDIENTRIELYVPAKATCQELFFMTAFTLKKHKHYVYLMKDRINLATVDPISKYKFRNGTILHQYNSRPIADDPEFPSTCLTVLFGSDTIVDRVYFALFSNEIPEERKKVLWRFLMLVPTAPVVRNLPVSDFLAKLATATSELEQKYLLQHAANTADREVAMFVVDALLSGQIPKSSIGYALMLVGNFVIFSDKENAMKFAKLVLAILVDDSSQRLAPLAVSCLRLFTGDFSEVLAECLLSDTEQFRKIICSLDSPVLSEFVPFFVCFNESKHLIFAKLVSFLDLVKADSERIKDYFQLVSVVFDESCDVDEAVRFCVPLLTNPGSLLFNNIASFLLTILERHPDRCLQLSEVFQALLCFFFECPLSSSHEQILRLISQFTNQSDDYKTAFKALLASKLTIQTDRWGYTPSAHAKSPTNFSGLRNLGATCYMNAVFQQLFHNPVFRRHVIDSTPEIDWHIDFRNLFIKLKYTALSFANTQPFVSHWHFEGTDPVNPRLQQDATEFLGLLLDRLSDPFYRGELAHIMEGEGFRRSRSEIFYALQLVVKDHKNLDESIRSFLENETVQDYYADSVGKKITINTCSRVRQVPRFLIVQLKRFDYDVRTWQRIKINSKFEFTLQFDIGPLLETPSIGELFELTGVVLHTGTAQGGHYTACVKRDGKWFRFDDTAVSEISQSQVLSDAYGGVPSGHQYSNTGYEEPVPSAYLLFYARAGDIDLADDSSELGERDAVLKAEIATENREFCEMQTLFSLCLMTYMLEMDDRELLLLYLFNVFAHSNHSTHAFKLEQRVIELALTQEFAEATLRLFIARVSDLELLFTHSNDDDILGVFFGIVDALYRSCPVELCAEFAERFLNDLGQVSANWKAIPLFLKLIIGFFSAHFEWITKTNWVSRIIAFIRSSLEGTKSKVFIQNVDFTVFFLFVKEHLSVLTQEDTAHLCDLAPLFLQGSAHADLFWLLIASDDWHGRIDFDQLIDRLLLTMRDPSSTNLASLMLQLGTSDAIVHKLLNSSRVPLDLLVEDLDTVLRSRQGQVPRLITKTNIVPLLLSCGNPEAHSRMERLATELLPSAQALVGFVRFEGIVAGGPAPAEIFWHDTRSGHSALPEDSAALHHLARALITRLGKIDRGFFTGPCANRGLCSFLRVLAWAVYRSHPALTQDQLAIVVGLFDILRELRLTNDCNALELMRVLPLFEGAMIPLIVGKFECITDVALNAKFDGFPDLLVMGFVWYFESVRPVLLQRPENLPLVITHPAFQERFRATISSRFPGVFVTFADLVKRGGCDISNLLEGNMALIMEGHALSVLSLFDVAPGFVMSDERFTALFVAVLRELPSQVLSYASQTQMIFASTYFDRIGPMHQFADITPLLSLIPTILSGLVSASMIVIAPAIVTMLEITARKSMEFQEALRTVVQTYARPSLPLLLLQCHLALFEKDPRARVVTGAAAAEACPNGDDKSLLAVFNAFVNKDGLEVHREWVIPLFRHVCIGSYQNEHIACFLRHIAGAMPADELLSMIPFISDHFARSGDSGHQCKYARLNTFCIACPGLRQALLAAANLTGQSYRDAFAKYTNKYPVLFMEAAQSGSSQENVTA